MITRKKKSNYGRIANCKEVRVLDTPENGAPLVCQIRAGKRVKVISKPNKNFIGIGITNSVVGFIPKDNIEME